MSLTLSQMAASPRKITSLERMATEPKKVMSLGQMAVEPKSTLNTTAKRKTGIVSSPVPLNEQAEYEQSMKIKEDADRQFDLKKNPEKRYPEELRTLIDPEKNWRDMPKGYRILSKDRQQDIAFDVNIAKLGDDDPLKIKALQFKKQAKPKEKTRGLYPEMIDASARQTARIASAAAGIVGKEDFAKLMWQVSKDPEIAAQRDDLTGKAINMIGETLPYITATTAATLLGGGLGGFAVGAIVEGGASYRQALDEGVPEDKARLIGVGVGMLNGAIETVGGRGAEALLSKAIAKLQGKLSGSVTRFGVRTVVEALEEGAQELSTITGESTYKDVDWDEVVDRTLGSMAGGAFLGGAFNMATSGTSTLDQVTNKKINNQQQEIRPEPAAETGKAGPIPEDMVFGKGLGVGSDTPSPRVQIQPDFAPRPKDIYRKQVRDNIEDTANEVARMDAELAEIQKPAPAEKKTLSLSEMALTVKDKSNDVGLEENAIQGNVEGSGVETKKPQSEAAENIIKVTADTGIPTAKTIAEKNSIDGKMVIFSENKKQVSVDRIIIPKGEQGKGVGTEIMNEIVSYADSVGKQMVVTPGKITDAGTTSDARLVEFYKKFGFVENKGKNKDLSITDSMYRLPSNIAKTQPIVPNPVDMAKKSEKVDTKKNKEKLDKSRSEQKMQDKAIERIAKKWENQIGKDGITREKAQSEALKEIKAITSLATQPKPATISPVQDNEVARDNIAPQDTTEAGKGTVKDELGKPITVYHGTVHDFQDFQSGKNIRGSKHAFVDDAIYFTDSETLAEDYARGDVDIETSELEGDDYVNLVKTKNEQYAGQTPKLDKLPQGTIVISHWFDKDKSQWVQGNTSTQKQDVKGNIVNFEYVTHLPNGQFITNSNASTPEQSQRKALDSLNSISFTGVGYQRPFGKGSRVVSANLVMNNPKIVDMKGKKWGGQTQKIISEAKAQGHDGVIIKNVIDNASVYDNKPQTTYVVFDSKQVISQSSFNRPAPEAGGQKPLTQEVKEKASQKEPVKKVNTYAIGKVNKEILKNEAYVFAKEQGGDPLGRLPLDIRQKYYIAPENWGEVKDAIDGIPYLQQIFKKGETQDRNKNFQIDRWAKEYYIRGNDTQEEIESSWGRVPGYEQYGDIELFTETIKQAYQLKKGSKGSISRVILEKAFESGHPEAIQLEWLIRKKDLFRDGMSKEQVDFAEKEFYNQINEDQENVDRTRERTSQETAEKADFDIEKTEVTGEEAKDFLGGLIEKSPARQKDLLGREELEGGASGKQGSFLDKENFKTIKAKEEINAEADIEGQKNFLQPQQKENNLFAEAAPMVEKAQKMADKTGSNRYVVRTANGKFQIRQNPPKNLIYLIIEPKTGEKPKGFNRQGGFADVSFLAGSDEPPGKKIVIKPRKFRRTLPVADQEIPQDIYEANRKTRRTVAEAKEDIKEFFAERKEGIERVLTSVSGRLLSINPELKRRVRDREFNKLTRVAADLKQTKPLLTALKKMKKSLSKEKRNDYKDFDIAWKNGSWDKINELAEKYNFTEAIEAFRKVDNQIFTDSNAVAMDMEYRKDHLHRRVKRPKQFMEYCRKRFGKSNIMPTFEAALQRRREQAGGRALSEDEQAAVLNSVLRGFSQNKVFLGTPGAAKERSVYMVDGDMNRFYYDTSDAVVMYITDMQNAITAREFFGKETREILQLRTRKSSLATRLHKLQTKQGKRKTVIDEEKYNEHISTAMRQFEEVSQQLSDMQHKDITDSIGGYVLDLVAKEQIKPQQENELRQLLQHYLDPARTLRIYGLFKKVAYLTHLNQIVNTMTQLKDYGRIWYRAPVESFNASLRAFIPGLKSKFNTEELGLEQVDVDMAGLSKVLDLNLRATGFRWLDSKMKEIYVDAVITKYQKQAAKKQLPKSLIRRAEAVFGKETENVIADLRRGKKTEAVKKLAFNELLDMHPLAMSEMTEMYLKSGGFGRYMYTLRTFAMKEMEYVRNEILRDMKTDPGRSFARLVWMAFTLAVAGAGVEALKDFIRGRDFNVTETVVDNFLNLVFLSRYNIGVFKRRGLDEGLTEIFMPPLGIAGDVAEDIRKQNLDELTRRIPVAGDIYYWRVGKGKEKIQKQRAKKQKKTKGIWE